MKTVYAPDTVQHFIAQVQMLMVDYPAGTFVAVVGACALFAALTMGRV